MEDQSDPMELKDQNVEVEKMPENPTNHSFIRKKKNSRVWDHFNIPDPVPKENPRCWCKYCKKDYAYAPSKIGTSSLWNHLQYQCLKYPFRKEDKKQKTLVFQPIEGGSLKAVSFSQEQSRAALAKMIILDELPFKFVEKLGFRYYNSVIQPKLELPTRTTVARDVIALYVEEKKKLKAMFSNSLQQFCLTTDTWTSVQNINYLVLTAHYIDDDWKLQKRILNFETIGKMIEACLIAWGIERVFTITVDNASSNDVAISYMQKKVRNWKKSVLNCDFLHMRCCAHILNLIVTNDFKDYDTSIQVIRNAVRYVRSSPSRLAKFHECVRKEKLEVDGSVCLDVPTRWNSAFLMLQSSLKFRRAFERLEEDGQYCQYFSEGSSLSVEESLSKSCDLNRIGPPRDWDWDAASNFMKFLELFYDVTNQFSGSLYVTSNTYFHDMCSMYTHIIGCMKDSDIKLSRMASEMKVKYDKYWGEVEKINPMLFIAVILDPRYKQEYVEWSFHDMYGDGDLALRMSRKVQEIMKKLFEHYLGQDPDYVKSKCVSSNTSLGESGEDGRSGIHERSLSKFKSFLKAGEKSEKTELENYLKDEKENMDGPFDLLAWWKENSNKYKILSRMARDVLAIPVSTVASESAFSTGGRVLDHFRSSLTPKTVQALICAQNWLQSEFAQQRVELRDVLQGVEEIEEVEKDFANYLNICTDHIE